VKASFILHIDSLCILDKMTDEQAGKFIKIIHHYQKTKQLLEMDLLLEMAITPFINQFLRDEKMYEKISEDRKVAGAKGGKKRAENIHKKKTTNKLEANEASASNFKQIKQNQANVANQADNDNDSDSVNDNKKESKKEKVFNGADAPTPKNFKQWTEEEFYKEVGKFKDDYTKDLLRGFYDYWREKDPKGKMRFQLQDTWETKLRLATWKKRDEEKTAKPNGSHETPSNKHLLKKIG
jgi:hypothetical protein